MSIKVNYCISSILVLVVVLTGIVNAQDPSLVGYWKLDDEGTGTAFDYSGNDRHGTINGNPQFVPGLFGDAMEFTGDPDYVNIGGYKGLLGGHAFSITAWIKTTANGEIVGWGNNTGTERVEFRVSESRLRVEHGSGNRQGDTNVSDNQWHHVALTVEENATISYPQVILYVDGEDDTRTGTDTDAFNIVENFDLAIGRRYNNDNRWFIGLIDEVRVYDRVLSAEEIQALAIPPVAHAPVPADGTIHSDTWISIDFSAGGGAASHDVYFGDNFEDVDSGAEAAFLGNQTDTNFVVGFADFPYPEGLVPGTDYYWRVDEVEANATIRKGDIWSFTIPAYIATKPNPPDGGRFVDPNATLTWTSGIDTKFHNVFFGDNFEDVNNASGRRPNADEAYTPGPLEFDKVYYWRVDEFGGIAMHRGDVWSFRTESFTSIYDPDLVAWWKFDDDGSGFVTDSSGYGHHGTIHGDPFWVTGFDGDALEFDNAGDYVSIDGYKGVVGGAFSITAWIRKEGPVGGDVQIIGWGGTGSGNRVEYRFNAGNNRLRIESGGGNTQSNTDLTTGQWHHVAMTVQQDATYESGVTFYLDGQEDTIANTDSDPIHPTSGFDVKIGQMNDFSSSRWYIGAIDDLRIYSKVLAPEEIEKTMVGDPRLSWDPKPANASTPNIDDIVPLSWSPGDSAASHDVYFGADKTVVTDAGPSDTTGIYRGRQINTEFLPSERLDYNQTFYWRVDEYNNDDTISRGRIWSFTVADFIVVDDFEDYNDYPPDRIFEAWLDGWDNPTVNGALVGYADPPFTEQTIVHSGAQSMPLFYDNNNKYSEATLTLTETRDWTRQGVETLSLWFRGYPDTFSTLTEAPAGTFTITARSGDIWGQSDSFHYVFKQLSGTGSIIAKVESTTNTNNSAKIGVMIRDTLSPDSKHAFTFIRPDGGIRFNRRLETFGTTTNSVENGLEFPHWVKLERDAAGTFTASHSSDGTNWVPVNDMNLGTNASVQMGVAVNIGLAVSSNNTEETIEAVFSNVSTTGNVTGQWQSQDIDIARNDVELMYVSVSNTGGNPAVVYHPDPAATQIAEWTEWNIALQEFADLGINLTNVDKLAIGFGDKNNIQVGGAGTMYFDDVRLFRPRP
ncbi:MAG: LamG domain-containing protein [Planctomycetes bacterium]|nr:LamG domain-containing protein [Planctomycetota bacterium]